MSILMESPKHETSFVVISRDEYESLKETVNVLSDKELMQQIRESRIAKESGNIRSFEDVAAELGI